MRCESWGLPWRPVPQSYAFRLVKIAVRQRPVAELAISVGGFMSTVLDVLVPIAYCHHEQYTTISRVNC